MAEHRLSNSLLASGRVAGDPARRRSSRRGVRPAPSAKAAQAHKSAPAPASGSTSTPTRSLSKKKFITALVATISTLACVAAAMWMKKHPSVQAAMVRDESHGSETSAHPSTPAVHSVLVSPPFNPQLLKKHVRVKRNLLLERSGAVASGCSNPQLLNDGNSEKYDGSSGYAFTSSEEPMLITLAEPVEMNRVRFLLWDLDKRTYRYILSISPDGKTWISVQDNSKKDSQSWQEIKFDRQKVKAVALKGIANSENNGFHVIEIEGYDDDLVLEKVTRRTSPRGTIKSSAVNLKPGIWAEYFDGLDSFASLEDVPDLAQPQSSLGFGASMPAPAGQGLHNWPFTGACAAVFTGFLNIDKPSLYTFFLESESGSRLYLDGELLIDNDGDHRFQERWEQADLTAGLHRIWIEYYTIGGSTGLNVSIKPKGESVEFISSKMLLYDSKEASGVDPKARPSLNTAAREEPKPMARFIKRDDKRGGSWRQDLGHDGYVIFNKGGVNSHAQNLPPYLLSLNSFAEHFVWLANEDPRGLEDPAGTGPRLSACEYSANDFTIEINAARNVVYRCSIYCLDLDKLGRRQSVQVFDGDKMLHEMDVGDMGNGTWLHYEVAGSLKFKFINTGLPNAVVSGMFFDSESGVHFRTPPQGAPSASAANPGVVAEYFDGQISYPTVDDVPTFCRLEPSLSFGATPPASADRLLHGWPLAGACAAIFHGWIKISQDDKYTFVLESDDGARLYIDGAKLADNDGIHAMKEVEGSVDLKTGLHGIWVEYFNAGGQMGLNVSLKQKDGKKIPIPAEILFHDSAKGK